VSPDALLGVRVDEAGIRVHECACMADGHVTVQSAVSQVLIGKDEPIWAGCLQDLGAHRVLPAIGNAFEETLPGVSRHASEHPLPAEGALIPFRDTGDAVRPQSVHDVPEDSVEPLCGLVIDAKNSAKICGRHSCSRGKESTGHLPLTIREMTPTLHGVGASHEYLGAVGTLVPLTMFAVLPESVGTGSPTKPTEYCSCRHNE